MSLVDINQRVDKLILKPQNHMSNSIVQNILQMFIQAIESSHVFLMSLYHSV